MTPSRPDDIKLVEAVSQRLVELRDRYRRTTGMDLVMPLDLDSAFRRFQRLGNRYKLGHFHHSDSERQATREIAQWTVDVNNRLCGQPRTVLQWRD